MARLHKVGKAFVSARGNDEWWPQKWLGGLLGRSGWDLLRDFFPLSLPCGSPTRPLWRCRRGCAEHVALYKGDLAAGP